MPLGSCHSKGPVTQKSLGDIPAQVRVLPVVRLTPGRGCCGWEQSLAGQQDRIMGSQLGEGDGGVGLGAHSPQLLGPSSVPSMVLASNRTIAEG